MASLKSPPLPCPSVSLDTAAGAGGAFFLRLSRDECVHDAEAAAEMVRRVGVGSVLAVIGLELVVLMK